MSGNAPRMRSSLDAVPVFEPGVSRLGAVSHHMNFNENHFAPLPSVLDVVRETAASFNRYPDMLNSELVEGIAGHFDVAPENVAVGGGGAAVLQQLLLAVVDQGNEVVFAWRSFEAYPILSSVAGARQIRVPLSGADQDLEAMLDVITDRTRLVFVCNPNNPTGTAVDHKTLDAFIDRAPEHVLIVLDEAYREFVRAPEIPDGIRRYRDRPNVAVLRTFSKAYGLAGLRVAFTVAHPAVARAVRKTALPFGVTRLAERAALASLRATDELSERVEAIVKERERMLSTLRAQAWPVAQTEANFVWLRLGERSADFDEACQRAGVLVRAFPGEGVRITVGPEPANDIVLSVAAEFAR
ncbi:histidinol-phosphate transaminase [Planotetraspora phitsanulokensis]|nr:histidinol-phosphate transaminase [Planotetraspora phitsanulokensis]